jgi:hypothetical protein
MTKAKTKTTLDEPNPIATEPATEPEVKRPNPAAVRQWRESLEVSRVALADMTGLPLSRIWAAEQPDKTVTDEHRALIIGALDGVEKNGLPEKYQRPKAEAQAKASKPKQPTKAALEERLRLVVETLATTAEKKTLKELREVIEQASRFASGWPDGQPSFELAADESAPAVVVDAPVIDV